MSNDKVDHGQPAGRRLYGRRRGRPLRRGRAALLERLLPGIEVGLPKQGALAPDVLFDPTVEDIWLEIGFGAGEHLAEVARENPGVGIIGSEVFINGVASLLRYVDDWSLRNVRVCRHDARALLEALSDKALARVFLLHPDPWPKRRHAARRFIQAETLAELARVMRPGAELRISTDDPGNLEWTLLHMQREPSFRWLASSADDWRRRPEDWPETRYERKALAAGRRCTYLRYRRSGAQGASAGG